MASSVEVSGEGSLNLPETERGICEWGYSQAWACRSISRFLCPGIGAAVILLDQTLLPGSSNLPGSRTERTAPPPLFGLAPHGVCPARRIAPSAVRSYRTFSPLPSVSRWRYVFCGTFRKIRFERTPPAVSRHAALWRPDFPPALSGSPEQAGDCPTGTPISLLLQSV